MKVAISGSSGLVGTALREELHKQGHTVQRLVRQPTDDPDQIYWNVDAQQIEAHKLVGTDAVVHLAGEPIAGVRWTEAKKQRVMDSRAMGTRLVAQALADLDGGPQILISASATGYYGDTTEWVDEDAPAGQGFLADVCTAWEQQAKFAKAAGIRVVHPRFGLILDGDGGVLAQMLTPFKLGLGGPLGDGSQYFPWVAIDDTIAALIYLIEHDIEGPVNIVAPNPVTNAEFTAALGDVINRPTVLRVPKFAVRTLMGEMGNELLLSGQRVRPQRLLDCDFPFKFEQLRPALNHVID